MGLDCYVYCNSKKVKRDAERVMDEYERECWHKSGCSIYWRKANAIHKWIVDHCWHSDYDEYDGRGIEIEVPQLEELKATCETVLATANLVEKPVDETRWESKDGKPCKDVEKVPRKVMEDPSIAQELLPTQKGFFFGSYEYDEWYVAGLKHTVDAIDAMLEHVVKDPDGRFDWEYIHEDEPDWHVRFEYSASW